MRRVSLDSGSRSKQKGIGCWSEHGLREKSTRSLTRYKIEVPLEMRKAKVDTDTDTDTDATKAMIAYSTCLLGLCPFDMSQQDVE